MSIKQIPVGDDAPHDINVLIEIPRNGEAVKYEVDKDSGMIMVDRVLNTAFRYPCNYGFVPHTLCGDGDPVDVLVLTAVPVLHASVICVRPIGVLKMEDAIIFFPLFIRWVGFNQTVIPVEHASRESGESSYNWMKLIKLAANTIVSFSDKPLRLFLKFGLLVSCLSFLGAIYVLIQAFRGEIEVMGYSSIFISICFFSGIIITTLGILGIYIGKSYNQSKKRPLFIIDDEEN